MTPLGFMQTPFPEKFAVPRQPGLVPAAWGKLVLPKNDFYSEAFRGIEGFSHLWLIFEFHHIAASTFNALVRPPRFGNKKKLGVYATRTPHRPNRLGLSVVQFDRLEITDSSIILWVKGVDLVSGTPIYDIKPYLPYTDNVLHAQALDFPRPPRLKQVIWQCAAPAKEQQLIEQVLALDPRPAQDQASAEEFGMSLAGWNVRFAQVGEDLVINSVCAVEN